jgi:hypothetical protein
MLVEKAANTPMFRRSKAIFSKKGGDRVETCIVKAVHTYIPPAGIGKHLGFFQSPVRSIKAVQNEVPAPLRHSLLPSCSTL